MNDLHYLHIDTRVLVGAILIRHDIGPLPLLSPSIDQDELAFLLGRGHLQLAFIQRTGCTVHADYVPCCPHSRQIILEVDIHAMGGE